MPGCEHVFGNVCLGKMIWHGRFKCPICGALWYDVYADGRQRVSVLKEAWPWRPVKLPVAGTKGKVFV